ncbi:MAG TPA: hypothetical protein VKZ96_08195 [Thermomicrobiales bacterium]|nr:hypothetical protein [Thermomicrobiales bacterium]
MDLLDLFGDLSGGCLLGIAVIFALLACGACLLGVLLIGAFN